MKTKVHQNCYTDLSKTSLLPECCRLYPGMTLSSRMTVLRHTARKSDATLYTKEHSRLHIC